MGWIRVSALGAALLVSACTGIIGDGDGRKGNTPDGSTGPTDPVDVAVASLETSRFPRLSHFQWENTVRDLFSLNAHTGLSIAFSGDALGGLFDNNEAVMLVTPNLWGDYQVAAEELAQMVVNDPAMLASIVPADMPPDLDGQATAFIEFFGKQAYRRPLTADEVTAYQELFTEAQVLLEGNDPFLLGVQVCVQAFMQSPHFLYRVQAAEAVSEEDGLIHLDDYEIASKLSYLLWNTMPDPELFAAADAGTLTEPDNIMAQAERMLIDPRANDMVAAFHEQLYGFDHYEDLYKDPALYPSFPSDIGADLHEEARLFIDDVVFSGGGIRELLTANTTYVNADLAAIYGLQGTFDDNFQRVTLDAAERSGFLTRIGFLASNANAREQNTIHRGVFINRRIICSDLPDPPDDVEGLPPADDFDTNRERVDGHTGAGTCGESCHMGLVNPPGFAFENYDAVGGYQVTENGFTVDASGIYRLDGQDATFNNGLEFSQILAESPTVHSCYSTFWLQFAYGRLPQAGDDVTIEELSEASLGGGVKHLIVALTQTKAFRTRGQLTEEEGQ